MAQAQRAVAQDDEQASGANRRPVDTARHGNVEIAIWRNTGEKGEFFSASAPSIRYRDDAGEWKDGSNFNRHDLLDLAQAAQEAATKIRDLQKSQSRGR